MHGHLNGIKSLDIPKFMFYLRFKHTHRISW